MDRAELSILKHKTKKQPTLLARGMMSLLIGKDKLKKMTPFGTDCFEKIPADIFAEVYGIIIFYNIFLFTSNSLALLILLIIKI